MPSDHIRAAFSMNAYRVLVNAAVHLKAGKPLNETLQQYEAQTEANKR